MTKESTALVLNVQKYGLEQSKAEQIKELFTPIVESFMALEPEYNKVLSHDDITNDVCAEADDVRKKFVKVRTATDKAHKIIKADLLAQTKAIDEIRREFQKIIKKNEETLSHIATHFERLENEKLRGIGIERGILLRRYDCTDYLGRDDIELGGMPDDIWNRYIAGVKSEYEAQIAAKEKAEEERLLAEQQAKEEQEKQRLENIKLKEERDRLRAELAKEKATEVIKEMFVENSQQTIDENTKPLIMAQDMPDDIKMVRLIEDLQAIYIPDVSEPTSQKHCQIVKRDLAAIIKYLQQFYKEDL